MYKVIAGLLTTVVAGQLQAAATNSVALVSATVPTLDEVGLVGISIIVAIAGGIAARRRKK